jgi:hypothetical protein
MLQHTGVKTDNNAQAFNAKVAESRRSGHGQLAFVCRTVLETLVAVRFVAETSRWLAVAAQRDWSTVIKDVSIKGDEVGRLKAFKLATAEGVVLQGDKHGSVVNDEAATLESVAVHSDPCQPAQVECLTADLLLKDHLVSEPGYGNRCHGTDKGSFGHHRLSSSK